MLEFFMNETRWWTLIVAMSLELQMLLTTIWNFKYRNIKIIMYNEMEKQKQN